MDNLREYIRKVLFETPIDKIFKPLVSGPDACDDCKGTGKYVGFGFGSQAVEDCQTCGGTGQKQNQQPSQIHTNSDIETKVTSNNVYNIPGRDLVIFAKNKTTGRFVRVFMNRHGKYDKKEVLYSDPEHIEPIETLDLESAALIPYIQELIDAAVDAGLAYLEEDY